jgi:hypothetical protein
MKINLSHLLLTATTTLLASSFSVQMPAQALTWTLNDGSTAGTNPITGSFTIDDEDSVFPSVTFSDLMVGGLTFTANDVLFITSANPSGTGIDAIDWFDGFNSLSLVFNSPLTAAGGTILLDDFISDFNGDIVSGSVTGVSVPEPSRILSTAGILALALFSQRRVKGKAKK